MEHKLDIIVDDVKIKIQLDEDDYDYAYNRVYLKHPTPIESEDAIKWLQKCIVQNITPIELENERTKELNAMDMMQNHSLFNNSEVIFEMQILATIFVLYIHHMFDNLAVRDNTGHGDYLVAFLILHIMSYLAHFYRLRDIALNGKPDVNGIYTAKKEALISNIETFIICIMIGFTIKHYFDTSQEELHSHGIRTYFLIFDCFITFFVKGYIYFGQMMKVSGEVTKNIYTLF